MSSVFAYLQHEQPELTKKQIALVSTDIGLDVKLVSPMMAIHTVSRRVSCSGQRLSQCTGGQKTDLRFFHQIQTTILSVLLLPARHPE